MEIMKRTIVTLCWVISLFVLLSSCNGKENSEQEIFYYDDGKVKAIKRMRNNALNGPCFWFYPNGKLEQSIMYINGEAEGHTYHFYESGALKARGIMKEGKTVGYNETFYDHSVGMHETIRVFTDSGNLIYIKQFDTSGKVIKEEGQY